MLPIIFSLFLACGEKEATLSCTEETNVLQECDAEGTCTEVEDCAANGQICHDMGADSHCMPGEEHDSGMDM